MPTDTPTPWTPAEEQAARARWEGRRLRPSRPESVMRDEAEADLTAALTTCAALRTRVALLERLTAEQKRERDDVVRRNCAALDAKDARLAALEAALNGQCFEHADNVCAEWCAACREGARLKDAALAGARDVLTDEQRRHLRWAREYCNSPEPQAVTQRHMRRLFAIIDRCAPADPEQEERL